MDCLDETIQATIHTLELIIALPGVLDGAKVILNIQRIKMDAGVSRANAANYLTVGIGGIVMNMIEKVARAIAKANEDDYHWKGYNVCAKAAIEAMRDLPAGFNLDERRMFNAAIDKALED